MSSLKVEEQSIIDIRQALRRSEERYQTLVECIDEGFAVLKIYFDDHGAPVDYRFLEVNSNFEEQTGLSDAAGKTIRELVPDIDDSWFQIYGQVAKTGEAIRFENEAPAMNRWFDAFAFRLDSDEPDKVAILFRDVTERKRREFHRTFLVELSGDFARLTSADEIMEVVGEKVARHLDVSRVAFNEVDKVGGKAIGAFDWHEEDAVDPPAEYELGEFMSDDFQQELRAGRTVVIADVEKDFRTAENSKAFEPYGVRAQVQSPYFSDGRWKFTFIVCDEKPRQWRSDEIELIEALTARVWLRLERARAEEDLRLANYRKDQFMAVLSHELRNPLAPIKLALYMLDRTAPDSGEATRAKEVIGRQVDQLTRLVGDLLDVTRVARNKINLKREDLELGELIRQVTADHLTIFDEKEIDFELKCPDEPIHVRGDRNRLAQVVGNILQNASKFTESGGKTTLSVESDEAARWVEIHVEDTGMGIDDEILENIFEPFMQADSSLDRPRGGLGLGLALVKGLVDLHDGQITVLSDGPDQGTHVVIGLPLIEFSKPEQPSTVAEGESGVSRRVLVIEDNVDIAKSLEILLGFKGHQVELAYDGAEGIEKARTFLPDVVFCDIGLPEVNGYDVARRIRQDPSCGSTYLVALSGYAMAEDVEKSLAAGFDEHMAKPPDPEKLQKVLVDLPGR